MPAVRPPPRLPPSFDAHLHDLDVYRPALYATEDAEEGLKEWLHQHILQLRFDQAVQMELGDHAGLLTENVFEEPEELTQRAGETITQHAANDEFFGNAIMLHKSTWLRDVIKNDALRGKTVLLQDSRMGRERDLSDHAAEVGDDAGATINFAGLEGAFGAHGKGRVRAKASDTFSTRNVPFMLEVWQRAEGVNLDTVMMRYAKEEAKLRTDAKEKLSVLASPILVPTPRSISRPASPNKGAQTLHAPASLQEGQKRVSIAMPYDRNEASGGNTPHSLWNANRSSTAPAAETVGDNSYAEPQLRTLSRSTVRLLKKFTREGMNPLQPDQPRLTSEDIDAVLNLTLTGSKIDSVDPYVYTPQRGGYGFVPSRSVPGSAKTPSRRPRTSGHGRRHRGYTPGAWHRAMQEAGESVDGVVANGHEGSDFMDRDSGFRLVIPSTREVREDDDLSEVESDDGHPKPGVSILFSTTGSSRRQSKAGHDALSTPSISIGVAIRRIAKTPPQPKKDSTPFGLKSMDPLSPPIKHITDFLDTPYTKLDHVPAAGTPAYDTLFKVLMLGLRYEEDRPIRFESCRLVIALDAHTSLGRWDGITFRNVLSEMLKDGLEDERSLAAHAFCDLQLIDAGVLRELRKGLGELNLTRRSQVCNMLAGLDLRYTEDILAALLEDVTSTNWRVRQDVVLLLGNWLRRVAPPELPVDLINGEETSSQTSQEEDYGFDRMSVGVDNLNGSLGGLGGIERDTQTLSTAVPAVARSATHVNSRSVGSAKPPTESAEEQEIRLRQERRKELIQKSIDALLQTMWNDWRPEVRKAASSMLGQLGKGGPVFDYMIHLLSSPDPLRKVDALKCLSRAYAVKAIGLCKCREPKNREAIRWALLHDLHPSVRGEAIHAASILGLISEEQTIREGIFTLLETDKSSAVRKVAEQTLIAAGLIFPAGMMEGESGGGGQSTTLQPMAPSAVTPVTPGTGAAGATSRLTSNPAIPYPHILLGRTASECEIFLADSLVRDREQAAVIEQVHMLADKQTVIGEVAEMDMITGEVNQEGSLKKIKEHMPDLDAIHRNKSRKKIDLGIGEIVRKKPGVPFRLGGHGHPVDWD
ncbi:HEAT repeat-containing protein 4 [Borealophlyctis nickersoniae]|nr:HEAT repeat-containing protein 4 [Borealophlyctis nickersoniae]